MNRRGFLGSIIALAAAPAIVRADSLMRVVPRELTVSLAFDPPLIIEDVLISWDDLTRMALKIAHEKSVFIENVNREYDAAFLKRGDTLRIRMPNRYTRSAA